MCARTVLASIESVAIPGPVPRAFCTSLPRTIAPCLPLSPGAIPHCDSFVKMIQMLGKWKWGRWPVTKRNAYRWKDFLSLHDFECLFTTIQVFSYPLHPCWVIRVTDDLVCSVLVHSVALNTCYLADVSSRSIDVLSHQVATVNTSIGHAWNIPAASLFAHWDQHC